MNIRKWSVYLIQIFRNKNHKPITYRFSMICDIHRPCRWFSMNFLLVVASQIVNFYIKFCRSLSIWIHQVYIYLLIKTKWLAVTKGIFVSLGFLSSSPVLKNCCIRIDGYESDRALLTSIIYIFYVLRNSFNNSSFCTILISLLISSSLYCFLTKWLIA